MTNLIAKVPGTTSAVVIIARHYDTKTKCTNFPFVGANDGGSSAVFLLEMARVLARRKNSLSYWLVFFDGEEALQRWSNTDGLYGSRHFAQELSAQGTLNQVRAVILLDMIADAHLDIHREAHSTPWLSDIVFAQARRLGYGRYFLNSPWPIEDDHIPFLELGMPAVDIIDFDYGPFNLYWHTRYDTVVKCSRASLAIVGAFSLPLSRPSKPTWVPRPEVLRDNPCSLYTLRLEVARWKLALAKPLFTGAVHTGLCSAGLSCSVCSVLALCSVPTFPQVGKQRTFVSSSP